MNGKKNLVMGIWMNNPPEGLEQFIASLRHTTFHGDVCVFVDDVPPDVVPSCCDTASWSSAWIGSWCR